MPLSRRLRIAHDLEQERLMDTAIKVGFASTDMETVNQHFGSARSFAVYAVGPAQTELLEAAQFGELAQDGNEDKLAVKIALLEGCVAVYCQAVGASAVAKLLAAGIQPVKVNEGSKIKDLLADLQNELQAGPSSWLAKAIRKHQGPDPGRFAAMDNEGWDE